MNAWSSFKGAKGNYAVSSKPNDTKVLHFSQVTYSNRSSTKYLLISIIIYIYYLEEIFFQVYVMYG